MFSHLLLGSQAGEKDVAQRISMRLVNPDEKLSAGLAAPCLKEVGGRTHHRAA
jgi:hypothetical protein